MFLKKEYKDRLLLQRKSSRIQRVRIMRTTRMLSANLLHQGKQCPTVANKFVLRSLNKSGLKRHQHNGITGNHNKGRLSLTVQTKYRTSELPRIDLREPLIQGLSRVKIW